MVQYKLHYFNARGRAEPIRWIFAAAGQKYEDVRFEREKWPEYKKVSPLGQAPYLEVHDGGKVFALGQSVTIIRYLAEKFGLAGKDDDERALVNMYADQVTDFFNEMAKGYFEKDEAKKAELNKKFAEETVPNMFGILNAKVGNSGSGFFVSSGLTYVDLYFVAIIQSLGDKKNAALEHFPNLKALDQKILTHQKIAEWIEKRPKTDM